MKKHLSALIYFFFIMFSAYAQDMKEYHFKFNVQDKKELDILTEIISIDKVKDKTVYAYALQHEYDQFLALGYKAELIEKQFTKAITMATTVSEMANWDRYPTYEVYRDLMKKFESNFPSLCKLDSIGTTPDGRKLYVLKISDNVNSEENEPEFLYTSTMHGDETTGFVLLMRLADSLLNSYGTVNNITRLIDSTEIYINPNANPDGTYAGGNNTVASATRSNGYADLNRDFPDPRSGPNAPYQPETQAMMDFAEEHNFVMSANFHGGEEVLNYPWDTWYLSENRHADTEWFEKICTDYVTTSRWLNASYMTSEAADGVTHGASWYKIDGGRQDYMNYWHQCKEVTIEISYTKTLGTEYLNTYWEYNKNALINYIKEIHYGINGTVKDSEGEPLSAMIWVENYDETNDSSMVFTDPDFGDFYRPIENGVYDITAYADGYVPVTVKNITTENNTAQKVDFVLYKADSCTLTGIITDASNGEKIENAQVSIFGYPELTSTTNAEGLFFIENVKENNYVIEISKTGYTKLKNDIKLRLPDSVYNFALHPADIEDFESNDFNKYPWELSGTASWTIDNTQKYNGSFSAKSGAISHSNSSSISLQANIKNNGILTFYKKISSESGYDFLKFYIDGAEQARYSGEADWSLAEFEIESGLHTFTWTYAKDGNTSDGLDCAWIDDISFPGFLDTNDSITLTLNVDEIIDTLYFGNEKEFEIVFSNTNYASSAYYSVDIDDSENNSWISINKMSGTLSGNMNDTLKVNLSGNSVSKGLHTTNISITTQDLDIYTIPVSLYLKDSVEAAVNPIIFVDTLFIGDSIKHDLIIKNIGNKILNYTVSKENQNIEGNWIRFNKENGNINPEETDTVVVILDASDFEQGNYNCTIYITEQDNEKISIPVQLRIRSTLQPNIEFINETLTQGDSSVRKVVLSNFSEVDFYYTAFLDFPTKSDSWIRIDKESGTIYSNETDTISISFNTKDQYAGDYDAMLEIQETVSNTNISIPIHLTINKLQNVNEYELPTPKVYPNPFDKYLQISLNTDQEGIINISIYNVSGNLVYNTVHQTVPWQSNAILLNNNVLRLLHKGIYFIQIRTKNHIYTKQIIKN